MWKDEGDKSERWIDQLGSVIISGRDHNLTVHINGKVAWSAWRESREICKLSINQKIREWAYINEFVES